VSATIAVVRFSKFELSPCKSDMAQSPVVRRLAEDSTRAADIEQRGEYRENGCVRLIKIDEAAKESGS
jgi:hypothetical protein